MTLESMLAIIGGVLVCGGFWTLIQFLISRHDSKKESKQGIKDAIAQLQASLSQLQDSLNQNNTDMALQSEALMAIAQDRILYLCKCYLKQGWIYDDDLSSLRRMADAYQHLGGNGVVETEMDILDSKVENGTLEVKVRR